MAMSYPRLVVFGGAVGALAVMTVLSAALGYALPTFLPKRYTHYASAVSRRCFCKRSRRMFIFKTDVREDITGIRDFVTKHCVNTYICVLHTMCVQGMRREIEQLTARLSCRVTHDLSRQTLYTIQYS